MGTNVNEPLQFALVKSIMMIRKVCTFVAPGSVKTSFVTSISHYGLNRFHDGVIEQVLP